MSIEDVYRAHCACCVINEQGKKLPMYAHSGLGYTNGMHPTLSKVTMHLNSP